MDNKMKILSMAIGRDGCSGYRVKNPLEAVANGDENWSLKYIAQSDSGEDILKGIKEADIIFMRDNHRQMFYFLKNQNEIDVSKKLFVLDMDDDIFNFSPFTENYRWIGTENIDYDGKPLWRDGQNGFSIEENKKNREGVLKFMADVDLLTVSTPYLKEKFKDINPNIEVCYNSLDFNHWKKWDLKKSEQIRIGWAGGSTHYIDWLTIREPLKEICDKYGDKIKIVLAGCKWDGTLKGIPYEYHKWIDFEAHPYKMASLNLDIAIIPLADTEFNHSKSCIKWYEFSSLGVPSLVSNVTPYKDEIQNNALAYNSSEEFVQMLSDLIEDKNLREHLGNNACEWVKANRDLADTSKHYIQVFNKHLKIWT
jgi:glycosyltransferase involved in cell wall biosynthesis